MIVHLMNARAEIQSLSGSVLHVAPEPCMVKPLQKGFDEYLSGDLTNAAAQLKLDLTNLDLATDSIDLVLCIHVLEHIPDDVAALQEMRRILKDGGIALINVPIRNGETYEDSTIVVPECRRQAFGQEDHVRWYGLDIEDRLRGAGFVVEQVVRSDIANLGLDLLSNGLSAADDVIFVCS